MSDAERICHICKQPVARREFCAPCTRTLQERAAPPHEMTSDEREAEMRLWRGPLEVPFDLMHERIEALVGRPVWTHELGLNYEGLCKEARWDDRPATMEEIIGLVPEEKRIVIEL